MSTRPTTAYNGKSSNGFVSHRPQTADTNLASSPSRSTLSSPSSLKHQSNVFISNKDKANTSSDELIRDLENKVRKVVEQKRTESDKLRYAVAKKCDEVEKAKLLLQDLLKDSQALGLHYNIGVNGELISIDEQSHMELDNDPTRLKPIASISRRPVYSKHTKIHELEAKLEARAKATHQVARRTLVLEHIKKRLLNERIEISQRTNQLKQYFNEINQLTHELQKKDISAAEAVNQVQTRLTQQKADMEANVRKFRRELALRLKWSREKAKFENYYNEQLEAAAAKTYGRNMTHLEERDEFHDHTNGSIPLGPGILRHRKSETSEILSEDETEEMYRKAFQSIGVDARMDAIDPEEIIRICMTREDLKHELDLKHEATQQRIVQLNDQIAKMRMVAREEVPLSKRGTSQKLETKEREVQGIERQLSTVVDQYMFVEQSVRPIKIGLQQILQNVSNKTVNIDSMAALDKTLVELCEEMMRMLRETSSTTSSPAINSNHSIGSSIPEHENIGEEEETNQNSPTKSKSQDETRVEARSTTAINTLQSMDSFTSPYNVRIEAKPPTSYHIPGLTPAPSSKPDDEDMEESAFEVMDRAMVKRVSSVVTCNSIMKKGKDKPREDGIKGKSKYVEQSRKDVHVDCEIALDK